MGRGNWPKLEGYNRMTEMACAVLITLGVESVAFAVASGLHGANMTDVVMCGLGIIFFYFAVLLIRNG